MNKQQTQSAFEALGDSEFIVLTTFRKDGTPVPTTVWFAIEGDHLYVQTLQGAGKLKRIGHTTHVTMTPSDARGKTHGETLAGEALILDGDDAEQAERVLQSRYGIKRTGFLLAMGAHDKSKRAYLEVQPAKADANSQVPPQT